MHKSATKCNETIGKWCKNKHGASKIIDTFETYHSPRDLKEARPRGLQDQRGARWRCSVQLVAWSLSLASRSRGGGLAELITDVIWGKWRAAAGMRRKSGAGERFLGFLSFVLYMI
jgi:hypothetical protein